MLTTVNSTQLLSAARTLPAWKWRLLKTWPPSQQASPSQQTRETTSAGQQLLAALPQQAAPTLQIHLAAHTAVAGCQTACSWEGTSALRRRQRVTSAQQDQHPPAAQSVRSAREATAWKPTGAWQEASKMQRRERRVSSSLARWWAGRQGFPPGERQVPMTAWLQRASTQAWAALLLVQQLVQQGRF